MVILMKDYHDFIGSVNSDANQFLWRRRELNPHPNRLRIRTGTNVARFELGQEMENLAKIS